MDEQKLCLEVIVSSHFTEWVLGLKNKCFSGLASLWAFHTGVMLLVSSGEVGLALSAVVLPCVHLSASSEVCFFLL